jgi:hypothetical protein
MFLGFLDPDQESGSVSQRYRYPDPTIIKQN